MTEAEEEPTVTDMIEVIARGIRDVKGGINYDYDDFCRDAAQATLAAIEAAGRVVVDRSFLEALASYGKDGDATIQFFAKRARAMIEEATNGNQ